MKSKITKRSVDAMKPGDVLADQEVKGFVARRLASGVVTYGLRYRVAGVQRWHALGLHGRITPDGARRLAKKRAGQVADGRDPGRERAAERAKAQVQSASTVNALLDSFLDRHVRKSLRSAYEVERALDLYVRPRIGERSIYDLRRRDMAEMLDAIEDQNGPIMADRTLAYVRKAFNWQAIRDDTFVPPIVRGMARTRSGERSRHRVWWRMRFVMSGAPLKAPRCHNHFRATSGSSCSLDSAEKKSHVCDGRKSRATSGQSQPRAEERAGQIPCR